MCTTLQNKDTSDWMKGIYTDLVGQMYLNSDWGESFPSDSGLVYPVMGRKRHL